ncbi:rhodanese-like domain-containing protein [Pontibacter pudoricolor]|uniref:rhodanese-like domain-containing protein n=1 Tax=Pontibacter pudoricolor TaxID=2694930 RepID=UPI0013913460|nr:rhodanese-like domain-containing protein [Pontibacter pudoricolor]
MPKRILFLILFIVVAIVFTDIGKHYSYSLLTNIVSNQAVPNIDSEELYRLDKPYVLLDVRTPAEYKVSHIKGARHVNYNTFQVNDQADIRKDARVVVYCSVGVRSSKAGLQLLEAGYTDVQQLHGGIFNWVNNGYPVFDANGQTNRIHGYTRFWGYWLTEGVKVYGP